MQDGIFVSYSHQDSAVVEKIVATLKEVSGMEVWFDHELRGGENYFSIIANQIVKNRYFVFIVSDHSVESEWCLRELEFAASEKRQIVAIWLDNITIAPRIKLIIQNTHYINWYSTTNDFFSQSVAMAFNGNAGQTMSNIDRDTDDSQPNGQKYFLTKDQRKTLTDLLRAEETEKYAVCFQPENANLLGMAYEMGIFVEPDPRKAALYYKASWYAGNADGQFLYAALRYQEVPPDPTRLTDMIEAADQGGVLAMTNVGDLYYEGRDGIPVDTRKAYEYYERAARAEGATAMYYTAYGYRNGEILPKDMELAYMYASKAKEKEFPRAYRLLAFMYQYGDFVDKDPEKAIALFDEAIRRGDKLSLCYQGFLYGKLGQMDKKVELYSQAVEAAESGEIRSGSPYYRMAVLYDDGLGVEQDHEKAAVYYLKAMERNHKNAHKWVVPCILHLEGEKQISYLQRACELKCGKAAYELGKLEKSKCGGDDKRLSEEAVRYFETGAELGEINCVLELLWNYSSIIGNGRSRNSEDRANAIKWFRFLFANADDDFADHKHLPTYYYAYAIELDYDPSTNTPDREFVLYNFKKSLEGSPLHLGRIVGFAVDGYLFPVESSSGLTVDVPHAEELLALAQEYLPAYHDYLQAEEPTNCAADWARVIGLLKKGYQFMAKCYKTGNHVPKDKEKAEKYTRLAATLPA